MSDSNSPSSKTDKSNFPFAKISFLRMEHVRLIDDALRSVGEYGEVRLVVEKGRLRFICVERSLDIQKIETDR